MTALIFFSGSVFLPSNNDCYPCCCSLREVSCNILLLSGKMERKCLKCYAQMCCRSQLSCSQLNVNVQQYRTSISSTVAFCEMNSFFNLQPFNVLNFTSVKSTFSFIYEFVQSHCYWINTAKIFLWFNFVPETM